MTDQLIHATAADNQIRCMAAVTTNLVGEACRRHQLPRGEEDYRDQGETGEAPVEGSEITGVGEEGWVSSEGGGDRGVGDGEEQEDRAGRSDKPMGRGHHSRHRTVLPAGCRVPAPVSG